MVELIKKVALINVLAALVVWLLSQYVDFFRTSYLSDLLFFIVIVLWILAKLMWEGGIHTKTARLDDGRLDAVYKMVKDYDFDQDEKDNQRQNYQDGFVLFIAAIPALIGCIVLQFF